MTAPDRIYCDTHLGNPMYSYTNHHDVPTRIEYIRADHVFKAVEQLESVIAMMSVSPSENVVLRDKVLAAIKTLKP